MSIPERSTAFLDASVLVPAALRDTLLRAAAGGLYTVWFSDAVLEEMRRTLVAKGFTSATSAERLIANIRSHFWFAFSSGFEPLMSSMTNDPDDRHVLAAAVKAQVSVLVTANLRHFPRASVSPHGIEVMSPDAFLVSLLRRDTDAVLTIIRQQAAALYKPPLSVEDILNKLHIQAPAFVEQVAARIESRDNR